MIADSAITLRQDPQTQCRLFSLPAEIRKYVHTLLFTVSPNESGRVRLSNHRTRPEKPTVLAMLQTCRLVNDEAQALFYNIHHIELLGYDSLFSFFRQISTARLSAIHTLTVYTWSVEFMTGPFRALHRLNGLKTLYIELFNELLAWRRELLLEQSKREWPLLKATAAARLPSSLAVLKIELLEYDPRQPIGETASRPVLEQVEKMESELKAGP